MDKPRIFSDFCALIQQKCPAIFSGVTEPLANAFERACAGSRFPGFWLEMPLQGAMHTDLFVQYWKSDLIDDCSLSGDGFGYQPLFSWFAAEGDPKAGIALSVDILEDGSANAAAAYNVNRSGLDAADAFFTACRTPEAIPLLHRTISSLPADWHPWYISAVWNRPERFCRADCFIPAKDITEPCLLSRYLEKLGYTFDTGQICAFASELVSMGFRPEIQIDRLLDGSMRKTLNLSANVSGQPQAIRRSFTEGAGAALVSLLRSRGMADERAEQIGKAAFSAAVPDKYSANNSGNTGIVVKPVFIKTVWTNGLPQTAKVYVECLTF